MESKLSNLAALVDQMPATDFEIETLKAQQQKTSETVPPDQAKRRPRSENSSAGSKFTGPDPETVAKICAQIVAAGQAGVVELIGLIREPGSPEFKNYKAEYLLHCLVLYAGHPSRQTERKLVAGALASQLGNGQLPKTVRGLLVRELQWVGDQDVATEIGKLLDDEELCQYAVAALAVIGGSAGALLRAALPKAKGRNRLFLVQNLGVLKDVASIGLLRQALSDADREVRLAAAWALANLSDAGSIDLLLNAADSEANYERIKVTQACLLLAENLTSAGQARDAARIYIRLRDSRTDKSEKYIRDLAEKALAQAR